jgi:hypothetical protein
MHRRVRYTRRLHSPGRGAHRRVADQTSILAVDELGMAPTFEQLEQHRRRIKDAFSLFELEVRAAWALLQLPLGIRLWAPGLILQ